MVPPATPLSVPPRRADTLYGQKPTVASEMQPCDRCPSETAKVKTTYAAGPVHLCGHHARESWTVLERTALRIRGDVPTGSYYLPTRPIFSASGIHLTPRPHRRRRRTLHNREGDAMLTDTPTVCEQLHEDIELLDAAGWPLERVRSELSHGQIEEMIEA